MPVSDGDFYVVLTATAGQTVFAFTFPILEAAHLAIYKSGTKLAFGVDYTVSGTGFEDGGTATLIAACAGGEVVMLRRETPVSQLLDLAAAEGFYEQAISDALDKLTMIVQELNGTRIPLSPAGYMLRINASGTGIEAVAEASGTVSMPFSFGASAPASGTYARGHYVHNTAPVPGGPLGWVCVTAGTPGVWHAAAPINLDAE